MPDATEKIAFERIVDLLVRHGVEFIVIGGQAEVLMGGARVTLDADLCYRRSQENLERLAVALRELKPTLRGAPPDLPFKIDAQLLALGNNSHFQLRSATWICSDSWSRWEVTRRSCGTRQSSSSAT